MILYGVTMVRLVGFFMFISDIIGEGPESFVDNGGERLVCTVCLSTPLVDGPHEQMNGWKWQWDMESWREGDMERKGNTTILLSI